MMKVRIIATRLLLFSFLIGMLSGCKDENEDVIQTAELINNIELLTTGDIVITQGTSVGIKGKGFEANDVILLRSTELNPMEIKVKWGFQREDENTVFFELPWGDKWTVGKWDVVVQRANYEQKLITLNFTVLSNVTVTDRTEMNMIDVKAVGWGDKYTDSFVFSNEAGTSEIVLKSTISAETPPAADQNYTIELPKELATGKWKLSVQRYNFDLRQTLLDFDYFKIEFLNQDTIRINKNEEYVFYLKLNKVLEKDELLGESSKSNNFTVKAANMDFDKEKQLLRVVIPAKKVKAAEWTFAYKRNGIRIFLDKKQLVIEE